MHPLKMKSITAKRFTTVFWLALFISPIYIGVMGTGVASASKLGTDSAGTYTHPSLGGPAETPSAAPDAGIKREGSGAKKHLPPVMKKEGSGGKKRYSKKHHRKSGHHGYAKKSEGSAGKKGYKKHHGKHHGKLHGKYEGSKGKGHGYGHHGSRGHGKGHHGKDPFGHVLKYADKLGLSEQQVAEIRKNRLAFMQIALRAEADHQIAHMEMESIIHSGVLDEGRMFDLGAVILESKKQKIHAMVTAKIAVMKILTPEQRKQISKIHQSHH